MRHFEEPRVLPTLSRPASAEHLPARITDELDVAYCFPLRRAQKRVRCLAL